jgi:hypothetical protein
MGLLDRKVRRFARQLSLYGFWRRVLAARLRLLGQHLAGQAWCQRGQCLGSMESTEPVWPSRIATINPTEMVDHTGIRDAIRARTVRPRA